MSGAFDWRLEPVSSPLVEANPRICLVGVHEFRHGLLAGRWLDLRTPAQRLNEQVESLALATSRGWLGLFDYEGVPGGITSATTITELLHRCQQ